MRNSILRARRSRRYIITFAAVAALLLSALATAPLSAQRRTASVEVKNNSAWTIVSLYMSPTDEARWGPDQLGSNVIAPGASFTLTNIPCDNYDIKLVDEDGDECIVSDANLCRDEYVWTITSAMIASCASGN